MTRAFLVAALVAGCQPTGQLVLHVDSDALVPPRPGDAPDPARGRWLFDRLRIEISSTGTIVAARDFELDEGLFLDDNVSFGIAPQPFDQSLTARIRLFRGDHATTGQPSPSATLDTTYVVPPIDAVTVEHVTARLRTDDVGQPLGPITFDPGPPGPSQIGSWPGGKIVPCHGTAAANEACVPGGAFWMGDPILRGLAVGEDADRERLTIVSPFYIDLHEVTVAEARKAALPPFPWNQSLDPDQLETWCTYTDGPSSADPTDLRAPLAANCITAERSLANCRALGKTLPTETQFEFLASGRGAENAFAWGDDEPQCSDAVWGLGGLGTETRHFDSECRTDDNPIGVRAPGSGARDRVALVDAATQQTRSVVDLAGNLAEWMLDNFVDENDPFWTKPGVRRDPLYQAVYVEGVEYDRSIRGGNWHDIRIQLRAAYRRYRVDTDVMGGIYDYYDTGWRCARPGT